MSFEPVSSFECKRCGLFSTDASLSTAEQQKQMREHLEASHPFWDLENVGAGPRDYRENFRLVSQQRRQYFCNQCKAFIAPTTAFCPNCGAYKTAFIESDRDSDHLGRTGNDRKHLLGIMGSILLFIGVFTPIISAPFIGSINYFQNGKGDGVLVLILALISLGLSLTRKYAGLWITGVGSLAIMLFTFVNFQLRMSQLRDEMERDLSGNPFRGIADVAMQSIQIQWGWAVLVVGAALLIAAAAIREKPSILSSQ